MKKLLLALMAAAALAVAGCTDPSADSNAGNPAPAPAAGSNPPAKTDS